MSVQDKDNTAVPQEVHEVTSIWMYLVNPAQAVLYETKSQCPVCSVIERRGALTVFLRSQNIGFQWIPAVVVQRDTHIWLRSQYVFCFCCR